MAASGRVIGSILVAAGLILGVVITVWILAGVSEGSLRGSGAALGFALLFGVIVIPLIGVGGYLFLRGRAEASELVDIDRQRKLLDMVKTRGKIEIADAVLELNTNTDTVHDDVYALVGRGLFTGYVDWDKGELLSIDARELKGQSTCPNCGGPLELGGKGLIKCPYCGAEIFV